MSTVAITQNIEAIGNAIAESLEHVPLERIVRGKVVAVKTNETWADENDITAVTRADTLRAVLAFKDMHSFIAAMAKEAGRLGVGETDTDSMTFPALNPQEAIEAFTEVVYGERLTFEHS